MGRQEEYDDQAYGQLRKIILKKGYPESLAQAIAVNLRTEKMIGRMIGYLNSANPGSAEEIVDEMLAIMEDRDRWIKKKEAEYYNGKYNELLNFGLGTEDE